MKLITLSLGTLSTTNLVIAVSFKKCSAFTHFDAKINKCVNNVCVCQNGSPNVEGGCPKHNGNYCRCCKKGYTWKKWKCVIEGDTSALEPENDSNMSRGQDQDQENPFDYNEPLENDEEYDDYEDEDENSQGMEEYYPEDYEGYDGKNDEKTEDYDVEEININDQQNGIPSYNYVNVVNSIPKKKPEEEKNIKTTTEKSIQTGKMIMITQKPNPDYDPESEAERWKKLAILYNRFRAAETDDSVLIAMDPDFPKYVEQCEKCKNCYLPHKRADALFVHCGHSQPYFKICPSNLIWSQELMVCTWGAK